MGKRDTRRRRDKRRERRAEERARERERAAAAPAIQHRTTTFRGRGAEVTFGLDPKPVQGGGSALTPDEARARLVERAFERGPADA